MILSVFRNFTMQTRAASTADPAVFTATHKKIGDISRNPSGHVLGIIGLSNISKKLVLKAQVIGIKVHYYDVVRQGADEEARLDVTYHDSLKSLLQISDCVSLHTPLATHNGGGAVDTRINFELNAMKNILAVVGPDGEFAGEPLTPVNRKAFEEAS